MAPGPSLPETTVSDLIPLIAHPRPDSIFAYRGGRPVTAAQFLAHARHLAEVLPSAPLLNACTDRYHFVVGLAAAAISGTRCLLPPTHAPEVIRYLQSVAPDAICLTDAEKCPIDLPQIRFPDLMMETSGHWPPPQIPAEQAIADVFTSGSTGTPVAHRKHWGPLVRCVRAEATRFALERNHPAALVATVPAQHMYGRETSVL